MKNVKKSIIIFSLLLCSVVYSNKFIKIKQNEKYGLMDLKFNIIFPTIYSNIIVDDNNFFLVNDNYITIKENNQTNFVIAKHNIYTIERISGSFYFLYGRGPGSIYDVKAKKFILQEKYINKSLFGVYLPTRIAVEKYYISLENLGKKYFVEKNYIRTYPFVDDRAIVLKEDWTKALINKDGEIILDNIINSGWEFKDGLLPIITKTKSGFINKNGEFVIECPIIDENKETNAHGHPTLSCFFSDGVACVHTQEKEWQIIDRKGKIINKVHYKPRSRIFSEGLLDVFQNGKCGYINTTSELVIPFVFDDAEKFNNGYAMVVYNDENALLDKEGNVYLVKDLINGNKNVYKNVLVK